MIVFGIGAHLTAIGGVENSVRSMLATLRDDEEAIVVCHKASVGEKLPFDIPLTKNIEVIEYQSITLSNQPLIDIYSSIFKSHPEARVICRHHLHVLAAKKVGLWVSYMVPSIISQQVSRELQGRWTVAKLRLWAFGKLHQWYQQRALTLADHNFAFSESMRAQILAELTTDLQLSDIALVKPGIDPKRFYVLDDAQKRSVRERLGLPTDKRLLLFVGRLVRAKGLDVAINSLALLPEDTELVLVGFGDFRPELETLAALMGVNNRIHWMGAQSNVHDYYQCADIFLMTSYYEPLGQTILEATACGLPVVAFKQSEWVDTATEELGLDKAVSLCAKPDATLLAECITVQSVSYERSLAISAQAHEKFSWRKLLDQLVA